MTVLDKARFVRLVETKRNDEFGQTGRPTKKTVSEWFAHEMGWRYGYGSVYISNYRLISNEIEAFPEKADLIQDAETVNEALIKLGIKKAQHSASFRDPISRVDQMIADPSTLKAGNKTKLLALAKRITKTLKQA